MAGTKTATGSKMSVGPVLFSAGPIIQNLNSCRNQAFPKAGTVKLEGSVPAGYLRGRGLMYLLSVGVGGS